MRHVLIVTHEGHGIDKWRWSYDREYDSCDVMSYRVISATYVNYYHDTTDNFFSMTLIEFIRDPMGDGYSHAFFKSIITVKDKWEHFNVTNYGLFDNINLVKCPYRPTQFMKDVPKCSSDLSDSIGWDNRLRLDWNVKSLKALGVQQELVYRESTFWVNCVLDLHLFYLF